MTAEKQVPAWTPPPPIQGPWTDPRETLFESYDFTKERRAPLALFRAGGYVYLLYRSAMIKAPTTRKIDSTAYRFAWTKAEDFAADSGRGFDSVEISHEAAELLLLVAPQLFDYAKRPKIKGRPYYAPL